MFLKLLILFIAVPFLELALLLYLADRTSWWLTLAMVVIPGIIGTGLARSQGWRTWQRIQAELGAGRLPTDSLLDAALIFVAGALLITPGLLTDLCGLVLLIPPTRRFVRQRLVAWLRSRFQLHTAAFRGGPSGPGRAEVIDSYVIDRSTKDTEPPA
jgi:UPF0716 protein FxsA